MFLKFDSYKFSFSIIWSNGSSFPTVFLWSQFLIGHQQNRLPLKLWIASSSYGWSASISVDWSIYWPPEWHQQQGLVGRSRHLPGYTANSQQVRSEGYPTLRGLHLLLVLLISSISGSTQQKCIWKRCWTNWFWRWCLTCRAKARIIAPPRRSVSTRPSSESVCSCSPTFPSQWLRSVLFLGAPLRFPWLNLHLQLREALPASHS